MSGPERGARRGGGRTARSPAIPGPAPRARRAPRGALRGAAATGRAERARRVSGHATTSALWVLGVVGLGALGWWLGTRGADAQHVDPARIVYVERRDLLDAVNASGRVEPLARVAVMSRASGIVKELLVDEGDRVHRGQVLAELDREQLAADLAENEADLASAEARLAQAAARLAEARLRLADPELAFAQRNFEQLEELFATGDVSQRERDDAELALEQVRFRIAQVEKSIPVLHATEAEARANLASARAAVERSRTALREATILSPIDGVVLTRDREVGDGVSSILTAGGNATQVMTLGDLSEMYVEARVDEVDLGRIREGMPAVVTVDAHRGRVLDGRVERIAPAGSVDTNGIVTFEVRVSVDDPDQLLRPDMTADAKLVLDRRDGVPTLPQRALVRAGGGGDQGGWGAGGAGARGGWGAGSGGGAVGGGGGVSGDGGRSGGGGGGGGPPGPGSDAYQARPGGVSGGPGSDAAGGPGDGGAGGRGGGWTVQRVVGQGDDARLETVEVSIGLSDGLMTEITAGLQAGDAVLVPATGAPSGSWP